MKSGPEPTPQRDRHAPSRRPKIGKEKTIESLQLSANDIAINWWAVPTLRAYRHRHRYRNQFAMVGGAHPARLRMAPLWLAHEVQS
jgi:hypothetical protein